MTRCLAAVATSHGTAHVFAISPFGGAVDAVARHWKCSIDRSNSSLASSDQRLQQQDERRQDSSFFGSFTSGAEAETAVPNLTAVARVKRS